MKVMNCHMMNRVVASLSFPDGQDKDISSIFPHFPVCSLIFPQSFSLFFLILVFRVGGSPTQEDPGYATGDEGFLRVFLFAVSHMLLVSRLSLTPGLWTPFFIKGFSLQTYQ